MRQSEHSTNEPTKRTYKRTMQHYQKNLIKKPKLIKYTNPSLRESSNKYKEGIQITKTPNIREIHLSHISKKRQTEIILHQISKSHQETLTQRQELSYFT